MGLVGEAAPPETQARSRRAHADSSLESSSTTHRRTSSARIGKNALSSTGSVSPVFTQLLDDDLLAVAVESPDLSDAQGGIDSRPIDLRGRDIDFDSEVGVRVVGDLPGSSCSCLRLHFPRSRIPRQRLRTSLTPSNETALPACCGWIWPQFHAKESRRWRRNACRSHSSSGSPPWPECSTPASRRGWSNFAPGLVRTRPPHGHQLAARLRRRRRLQALLLPARQRRPQVPADRCGLAPHPDEAASGRVPAPLVFAIDDSPTSGTGHTSRAPASITIPPRGRPGPSSSTATSGSVWPVWSATRSGGPSPCRSSRTCTSGPRMSAG